MSTEQWVPESLQASKTAVYGLVHMYFATVVFRRLGRVSFREHKAGKLAESTTLPHLERVD